jgi:hypothetical protein
VVAAEDDELLGDGGGLLIGSFDMTICLFGCIGFIRFKHLRCLGYRIYLFSLYLYHVGHWMLNVPQILLFIYYYC